MKAGAEIAPRLPDERAEQPVPIRPPESDREDGAGPDAEQQGAEAKVEKEGHPAGGKAERAQEARRRHELEQPEDDLLVLDLLGEVPDEQAADLAGALALQQPATQEKAGDHRIVVLESRGRREAQRRGRERLQHPIGEAVDQPTEAVEGKTFAAHGGEQSAMLP